MTLNELVNKIATLEGKKTQVSVGNIREIIACITLLEAAYRIKDETQVGEVFDVLNKQVKNKVAKGNRK